MKKRLLKGESGQAMVETALIMPTMIWMILGIIQLTMMQQARIMLEYAAFNAARAGVVWNMDPDKMERAAIISLAPTIRKTSDIANLVGTVVAVQAINSTLNALLGTKLVKVDVLNPRKAQFANKPEIEFDTEGNRQKTQLVIRVTYLYQLRIPFANWIMFESWYAGMGGFRLRGVSPASPTVTGLDYGKTFGSTGLQQRLLAERAAISGTPNCPYNGVNGGLLTKLGLAAAANQFFMPLVTTHTMRMQSNPFQKWAGPDDNGCN